MHTTTSAYSSDIVPILSGGGTRLSAHIGILQALKDMNIAYSTLVGVSGGSIIASLSACGYSIDDMLKLAVDTDFKQFTEFSLYRLLREGGLSSGNHFEKWMDTQLGGITFADLPKKLHILATDVNGGGPVLFNAAQTPDMKVSEAVRYSMSIPIIFAFKPFKEHLLVDGAILAEDALFEDWQGDGTPSVCFRLQAQPQTKTLIKKGALLLPQYISMLIRTFMTAISREYVNAKYWHNTIVIHTGDISAVDFSMSPGDKRRLFELGYETTRDFLPKKLASFRNYAMSTSLFNQVLR
ncbi:patatin-like phospholipase family protein [Alteromonas sp. CYL-A6]|uniref:patatin-like phospholipase family protein n=1 Tax=Alteromonas nitratireducens TaxID=3390813 RepID=UPI0034C08A1D